MKSDLMHFIRSATDAQLQVVLFDYIELHPESFDQIISKHPELNVPGADGRSAYTAAGTTCWLTQHQYSSIKGHCAVNNRVAAIKEHRTITGLGLKESKDWVEGMFYDRDHTGSLVFKF